MGIAMAAPCVALPLLFPGSFDKTLPLRERYWVKASVWIAIFSHIGNYFWTHYFYELLGAEYTFRAHRLNGVREIERLRDRILFSFLFFFTSSFDAHSKILKSKNLQSRSRSPCT